MPAQVPKAGMPSAIRFWTGSKSSKVRASLAIVVDSPPGSTSPSQRASCGPAYGDGGDAERRERREVLADVALEGEDSDDGLIHGPDPNRGREVGQRGVRRRCSWPGRGR